MTTIEFHAIIFDNGIAGMIIDTDTVVNILNILNQKNPQQTLRHYADADYFHAHKNYDCCYRQSHQYTVNLNNNRNNTNNRRHIIISSTIASVAHHHH
jgi:hypothetical protein